MYSSHRMVIDMMMVQNYRINCQQFRSVFTVDDGQVTGDSSPDPSVPPVEEVAIHGLSYPSTPEIIFSVAGVNALLVFNNHRKAEGPDEIPCLLQETHEELAPVLTLLFQTSHDTGTLPPTHTYCISFAQLPPGTAKLNII